MADILTAVEKDFLTKLLEHFRDNEWIDNATAREISMKSPTSIKRYLSRMVEVGVLVTSGENKGRRYQLAKPKR